MIGSSPPHESSKGKLGLAFDQGWETADPHTSAMRVASGERVVEKAEAEGTVESMRAETKVGKLTTEGVERIQ